ncbi:MAG TPA: hypothetical protein DEP84_25925 [Chloroflexi bacterium]|nr:hypothetical protein [Chloroflexota bacterium]
MKAPKLPVVLGLTILLSVMLLACSAGSTPPAPQVVEKKVTQIVEKQVVVTPTPVPAEPTTLTLVQGADIQCLNPLVERLSHNANISRHLYDQLAWLDRDLKIQPRLAISWKLIDETTWEVKLREGVTFSNGEPVTAEDVVATFNYAVESPSSVFFSSWDRMEVVDDTTVHVITKFSDPIFPHTMTRLFVFPASVLESDPEALCSQPIGSGPYKLVEWVKGDHMTLEAVKDHYLQPKIDRVIVRVAPEASTRTNMLIAGEADLIVNVPPDLIPLVESSTNARIASVPGIRRIVNIIDTRQEPLNDVRVRQAIAHAVDMDSILKNILGGRATAAIAARPPLSPAFNPDLTPYAYDPDRAKALLAEAGLAEGFELDYHYPTGRWLKDAEVAQAIAGYLEQVGIKVNLQTAEYQTFFGDWSSGKYSGMTMIGVIDFDGDPASTNRLFLLSSGPWSFSWTDPTFDELMQRSDKEMDPEARADLFRQMEAIIHEQAIWCCGYDQYEIYGIHKNLHFVPHPAERIILWDAYWEK